MAQETTNYSHERIFFFTDIQLFYSRESET